jgi:hypothetical protein
MKNRKIIRWICVFSEALIAGACIFETAAPQSAAATPTRELTLQPSEGTPAPLTQEPTWTLTQTLTLTFTPSLTPTFTIAPVTMTAGQKLSCVKGPEWILYEFVAPVEKGETVTLLARSTPDWPDYFYVRKGDGTECWAYGKSSAISGDPSMLPLREAPPLPTVTYVVQNEVFISLCDIFVRGANEGGWGADRLTEPSLATHASFSIPITAGYYDVLIKDCLGTVLYEGDNRPIGSEPGSRTQVIAVDVTFKITNTFVFNLCTIEIQPEGSTWRFLFNAATDGGPFAAGTQKTFTLRHGNYWMRLKRCPAILVDTSLVYVHLGMPDLVWV